MVLDDDPNVSSVSPLRVQLPTYREFSACNLESAETLISSVEGALWSAICFKLSIGVDILTCSQLDCCGNLEVFLTSALSSAVHPTSTSEAAVFRGKEESGVSSFSTSDSPLMGASSEPSLAAPTGCSESALLSREWWSFCCKVSSMRAGSTGTVESCPT